RLRLGPHRGIPGGAPEPRATPRKWCRAVLAPDTASIASPAGAINDQVGELGGRLIILGNPAIPALRALLDDGAVVDWYQGSEEATLGNGARYRVRDFAAYYLARITSQKLAFHPDFAARDGEIAKLLATLH